MADTFIGDLPAASGANLTDELVTNQGGTARTVTPAQLLALGAVALFGAASARPSSPATGQLYVDTTLNAVLYYDGADWRNAATGASAGSTIATDDFTGSNGSAIGRTTTTGALTWASFNGYSASISSNQMQFAGSCVVGLDTGYATNVQVTFDAVDNVHGAACYFRHDGGNNVNGVGIRNVSGTWYWYRGTTDLGTTGIAVIAGQTVNLALVGNLYTLTVGASSSELTDSNYSTQTHVAWIAYGSAFTIDNLVLAQV